MDEELWGLDWDDEDAEGEPEADAEQPAEPAPEEESYRPRWVEELTAPGSEPAAAPPEDDQPQRERGAFLATLAERLRPLRATLSRRGGDAVVATVDGLSRMGSDSSRAMSGVTRLMLALSGLVIVTTVIIALIPGSARRAQIIIVTGTPTFTPTATETPTPTETLGIPTLPPSWTPRYTPNPLPTWTPVPTARPTATRRVVYVPFRSPTPTGIPPSFLPLGWTAYELGGKKFTIAIPSDWLRLDNDSATRDAIIAEIAAVDPTYGNDMEQLLKNSDALALDFQAVQYFSADPEVRTLVEVKYKPGVGIYSVETLADLNTGYLSNLPNLASPLEVQYTVVSGYPTAVILYDLDGWGPDGSAGTSSFMTYIIVAGDDAYYLTLSSARSTYGSYYHTFELIGQAFAIVSNSPTVTPTFTPTSTPTITPTFTPTLTPTP